MNREALATALDVFHLLYAAGWIGISIASFWVVALRPYQQVITYSTISLQLLFLGCPLTLLSRKLRGEENGFSFTVYLLQKIGLPFPGWLVAVSTLLLFLVALYFTSKIFFRPGRGAGKLGAGNQSIYFEQVYRSEIEEFLKKK